MSTNSARCLLYEHDEMRMGVPCCSRIFLTTSKKYALKVLLLPYVSEALNVCRIVKLSPCPAACFVTSKML